MPMTPSSEAEGKICLECEGPATHWWAGSWICCDCHGEVASRMIEAERHAYEESSATMPALSTPLDDEILSEELRKALEDLYAEINAR